MDAVLGDHPLILRTPPLVYPQFVRALARATSC
jgi:hypothetical protein